MILDFLMKNFKIIQKKIIELIGAPKIILNGKLNKTFLFVKKQMIKTYIFLILAIFFEVAGTMLLPATLNFTKLIPTTILTVCYLSAFYLLTFVVNKLPIAIVYATWSGLGIFTIAILGYIFFKQSLSWQAILGLFLIVLGVVLVNSFTVKIN